MNDAPTVYADPTGEYSEGGWEGELNDAINLGVAQYNFYGSLSSSLGGAWGESYGLGGGDLIEGGVDEATSSSLGSLGGGVFSLYGAGSTLVGANNAYNTYEAATEEY